MSQQYLQLHSARTSLIIKLTDTAEILYWGKALPPASADQLAQLAQVFDRAVPQARIDHDEPVTLLPELGRGSYGSPGIEGHRNGRAWCPLFRYHRHQQHQDQLSIECRDEGAGLSATITLALDGDSGVLTKRIRLTNLGQDAFWLNKLALTIPLPYHAKELESYSGRWSREFQPQRQSVEHGIFSQENRRGRTSHEYFPGCLVGSQSFSNQQGEVWGFHLGWSGNHHWRLEAKSDGRRFAQFGELLMPGEIQLAAGESYQSPLLYCSYSSDGVNAIRQANHRYVRRHLLRFAPDQARPVHLNTWEGIYFDHDPAYICEMATHAAEIGVERFIIDDGWFKGRHHDKAALGDWQLDRDKYPDGLTPVIDHVNQLGMQFGLWVEPEMVNPDSDLFRQHPEWLLATEGYQPVTGRYQYVLNLQHPDCFDYLYQRLDALLSEHRIDYLKWDMNRELLQASHQGTAAIHGQTQAVYRLLDKLNQAHPEVEIESCSSGGGRIDYEILRRTARFWSSDCNDALERQTIQQYLGIFIPAEIMGAHIGPAHSHTTRRQHSINLRGLTALQGHMGVELDPVKSSPEEKQAFRRYIDLHKRYRPLLHSGQAFYLDSSDPTRNAYGVYSRQQLLVTVCQTAMPEYMLPQPLQLPMLEADASYQLKLVDFPDTSAGLMKRFPAWMQQLNQGEPVVVIGRWLREVGLQLPVLDPEAALLIELVKLD
ncbi:alpha-galactosidase [Vibrio sp.]|uniref:alpha-galactosidase n=1 Tax=Vibrio sp. TaxID=678 RepID=UPI003D14EFBE